MRLIDLEKVVFDCSGLAYIDPLDFRKTAEYFMWQLKEQPTIEPERKKGEWIYGEHDVAMCDGYRCNQCGFFVPWDYVHKFINYIEDYNFCPNCGADMRGKP